MSLLYAWKNFTDVARAIRAGRQWEQRERWPRERLQAWQSEKLAALVEHASTHSPFYRRHYGGRVDRRDVRLESLPVVTKALMMDHLDDCFADRRLTREALEQHLASLGERDELFLGEYRVMASSGSSGRKGIYVYDRAAWSDFLGGAMRFTRMMGLKPGLPRKRMAQVAAPDVKHMTCRGGSSISVGAFAAIRLSAAAPIEELVRDLNAHRPDAITAYPSVLALLADEQIAGRLRIAPASIATTSEVRTEEMTERIRRAWNVEPFNCLGLTETGITAIDCEHHTGLHVFEDTCIFEVVDEHDRPVAPGTPGHKVLVTNLYNHAQPFIRFEVTDLVTISDAPCPCGRTFRRITALEGRSDDILELPLRGGGSICVHPIQLRSPLAAMPQVSQYQISQVDGGLDIALALVPGTAAGDIAGVVEQTLSGKLAALGCTSLRLRVTVVPRIEREAGAGKFKLIKAAPRKAA